MFDMKKDSANESKIMIKKIPADRFTPVGILEGLNAKVLLESAYHETGKGKYSILLIDEAFTVYKENSQYFLRNPDGKKYTLTTGKKYLDVLAEFRKRAPFSEEIVNIPLPLGGIGYLGYEFFEEIEDIKFSKKNDRGLYDDAFIFGRNFMIFDHLHDEAFLVSVQYQGEIENIDLEKEIVNLMKRIDESDVKPNGESSSKAQIISPDDKDDFLAKVNILKEEIYKGNLLQCVLSRTIEVKTDSSPLTAYRNLRRRNPSPYMFYFNFGGFVLFGASPEVMVKVKDKTVTVRPIAGTRKRGKTTALDCMLEEELKNDPKEKAEHLMLLDLGRNDVGRIAKAGSVKVTEEMVVERYSKVMHLVSEVRGELDKKYTSEDAIYATFPAGTVSGAPKIQAIRTLENIEVKRRGPYAGLAGYFEYSGEFDSCIVIRSAVYKDGVFYLQAGAGIVYDSIPELEYKETQNKMLALLDSLNIDLNGGSK